MVQLIRLANLFSEKVIHTFPLCYLRECCLHDGFLHVAFQVRIPKIKNEKTREVEAKMPAKQLVLCGKKRQGDTALTENVPQRIKEGVLFFQEVLEMQEIKMQHRSRKNIVHVC